MQWAYDKRLTYRLAAKLDIPYPWTRVPRGPDEIAHLMCEFPLILKPAVKPLLNAFTIAKAWKVNDHPSLVRGYDEACKLSDPSTILVQELIPGGGEEQFSYAALCLDGSPVASLVALRTRQFPSDFGRASTFVETINFPALEKIGERVIAELGYSGLMEIEFKRDPRDGKFKLLDLNPRIWGWHTLGQRAGVDFSHMLWRLTQGETVLRMRGRSGVRWMRMSTDLPAALKEIWTGRLTARAYLKSLFGAVESAVFASDDPLPGLVEPALGLRLMMKRRCV
jgi:predicted ATP-grasp superfamily ATP-dependent carboligase